MIAKAVAATANPVPKKRWKFALLALACGLALLFIVFDWNWLRSPLERYVSDKTQREFRIAHLDVDLGLTPTIKLKDLYFANAPWSQIGAPMASVGSLEFSVSLRDLWHGKILVPRVALSRADLVFEKAGDGRKNWVLKEPLETAQPSTFRISSLSVDQGQLRYLNHGEPLSATVRVSTFEPAAKAKASEAQADALNTRYTTRYAFEGKYHDAVFSGNALTGDVLSFQESNIPFPIQGTLNAGTTRINVEGTIADMIDITSIDVRLEIAGKTLASLYPFLLLPLPASPPYAFRGHLVQKGNRYAIDDLTGHIGSTDVAGSGAYVRKEPRPLLTAKLTSKLLNLADLGPIIGLQTKGGDAAAAQAGPGPGRKPAPAGESTGAKSGRPTQADTNTRAQAIAKERSTSGDKILPAGTLAAKGDGILPSGAFDGGRLKAIDAEVDYAAARLKAPSALPVENMAFSFRLRDAVAKLTPLSFGFAGGEIVSDITIDARHEKALRTTLNADFRRIKVAHLFPTMPAAAKGAGELGAQIRVQGTGNSIADAAGNANGRVSAAISQGRISNLLDAIAGLNGGKVIALFAKGDKDIAVNCGGVAFGVRDGIGRSEMFVVETEQTSIDGAGTFSLKDEKFDMRVQPKPKRPGILSLRTPVHLYGSFRHPQFELEKGPMLARAGAAVALAFVNPVAALVPLIETGPGRGTDCASVLASVNGAHRQANTKSSTPVVPSPALTKK